MSMKKVILTLIILVVLATVCDAGVIAAKEENGVKAGITVAAR